MNLGVTFCVYNILNNCATFEWGPNWIRFGHHSGSEDGIETEAVFPGANRSLQKLYICKFSNISYLQPILHTVNKEESLRL